MAPRALKWVVEGPYGTPRDALIFQNFHIFDTWGGGITSHTRKVGMGKLVIFVVCARVS